MIPTLQAEGHEVIAAQYGLDTLAGDVAAVKSALGRVSSPAILVGHASDFDAITGCTAILCERGAVAGADVRGSATGTEEFGLLDPRHVTDRIHAVVLSGGSAFGLETCSGVRRFLEHKDKVLLNVLFRGRELQHIDEGRRIIISMVEKLADLAKIEKAPSMEGKRMTAMLAPKA